MVFIKIIVFLTIFIFNITRVHGPVDYSRGDSIRSLLIYGFLLISRIFLYLPRERSLFRIEMSLAMFGDLKSQEIPNRPLRHLLPWPISFSFSLTKFTDWRCHNPTVSEKFGDRCDSSAVFK